MIPAILRALELIGAGSAGLPARVDPGTLGVLMAAAGPELRDAVGDRREGRPASVAWYARLAGRPSTRAPAVPG